MKQMEVLLRQRPSEYVIQVGKSKSYDVTIPGAPPSIELVIENLLDRQGIYGDELLPLIFHLTESQIECLLNVSLLAGAFLYSYDDYLIDELDDVTLEEMDSLSSYNSFSLSQSKVQVGTTSVITPSNAAIELATQMAVMLKKYISASSSVMHLSTTAGVTDISVFSPTSNHMSLIDSIVERLISQVFIVLTERGIHWFDGLLSDYDDWTLGEMENYSPKMSLVENNGDVYMQFWLSPGDFDMSISSQIGDFLSSITAAPTPTTMHITSSSVTEYQESFLVMSSSASSNTFALVEKVLGVIMESFPASDSFDLSFGNETTQGALITTLLSVSDSAAMKTLMTDGIGMDYGLEFYDDDLLTAWDDWTLENMAEAARIA